MINNNKTYIQIISFLTVCFLALLILLQATTNTIGSGTLIFSGLTESAIVIPESTVQYDPLQGVSATLDGNALVVKVESAQYVCTKNNANIFGEFTLSADGKFSVPAKYEEGVTIDGSFFIIKYSAYNPNDLDTAIATKIQRKAVVNDDMTPIIYATTTSDECGFSADVGDVITYTVDIAALKEQAFLAGQSMTLSIPVNNGVQFQSADNGGIQKDGKIVWDITDVSKKYTASFKIEESAAGSALITRGEIDIGGLFTVHTNVFDGSANSQLGAVLTKVSGEIPTTKYKVYYDANLPSGVTAYTGALPTDSNEYEENDTATVIFTDISCEGYRFLGWSSGSSATVAQYSATGKKTFQLLYQDVTLYAIWQKKSINIDITWGDMSFAYADGIWNPNDHTYSGGGWSPNTSSSNKITIVNKGDAGTVVSFVYNSLDPHSTITGNFINTTQDVLTETTLGALGMPLATAEIYLQLTGAPTTALNSAIIGSITVKVE